ncbi:hypothetical protein EDD99_6986 [Streptomyces sp. 846.5]|nr:hypothetical protein [Streptomyces sp. 846.5]TDT98755.1 hypothetical protein EDD99_6986 [Streptomyces sp. 846.5]
MAFLVAGVALLAGCATQLGPASSESASTVISITASPPRAGGASPQQIARADVAARLRTFVAPSGARRLASAPAGAAELIPVPPTGSNDVVATGWWSYPGTQQQAVAWLMAHAPSGNNGTITGTSGSLLGGPQVDEVGFGEAGTALLQQRELDVRLAVHGASTLLRVDAVDTWRPAHPAAAVIPSGVTRIVLTATSGLNPGGHASTVRPLAAVTDAGQVAKVVALVNALPTAPVGVFNCPADFGSELTVDFYRGSGGGNDASPAAVVVDRMTGCGGTELSVRGGPQNVALADSGQQILDLLKVSFPRQVG